MKIKIIVCTLIILMVSSAFVGASETTAEIADKNKSFETQFIEDTPTLYEILNDIDGLSDEEILEFTEKYETDYNKLVDYLQDYTAQHGTIDEKFALPDDLLVIYKCIQDAFNYLTSDLSVESDQISPITSYESPQEPVSTNEQLQEFPAAGESEIQQQSLQFYTQQLESQNLPSEPTGSGEGIDIVDIYGGWHGVHAVIKNKGEEQLENIDWTIVVKGGLLGWIDVEQSGTIGVLEPGEKQTAFTGTIFGLGKLIEICIHVKTNGYEDYVITEGYQRFFKTYV